MLVFRPPEGENPDPRVLSIYLMFCIYLALYFLSFTFIWSNSARQLEVTKVTAADCKPFGGPPTQPWTQDPRPCTHDPEPYTQDLWTKTLDPKPWTKDHGPWTKEMWHYIICKNIWNIDGNARDFLNFIFTYVSVHYNYECHELSKFG